MNNNDIVSAKQGTRESIKKEFLEIYKDRPLEKVKVSDLINACSISRGTFYFHFADIYALYRECEKDFIDFLEEGLPEVNLSTVRRDYNKHIKVYSRYLEKYVEHTDMVKRFLCGSEGASFRQAWFDSIRRNYAAAMEFSDATSPSRRSNLIRFFAGGHLAVLSNWVLSDCAEPVEEVASIQAQVSFQGVFTQTISKKTR